MPWHARPQGRTCIFPRVYTHVSTHVCAYVYTHAHAHVRAHVDMFVVGLSSTLVVPHSHMHHWANDISLSTTKKKGKAENGPP